MHARLAPIVWSMVAAAAAPAGASVFKCAGDGGAVVYQDAPCAPGRELRNFATDPPALSVIPGGTAATRPLPGNVPDEPPRASRNAAVAQANDARAAERKFVRSGMSEAEVLKRLGRPDVTSGGSRRGNHRWAYLPVPADPGTITTLTFQNGNVVDVERKLVR